MDHFVLRVFFRDDKMRNLVLGCPKCNLQKNDKLASIIYLEKLVHMQASGKVREFIMSNTDKTTVDIEWLLGVLVREDLYEYIVNE